MNQPAHKTEWVNRTKNARFYPPSCTGKERDEETGYSYFGARYMDHELMTMWLSVDPMADKYPSISPYAYCNWNPVKLVDPDGREVYINGDQSDMAVGRLQTKKMEVTRDSQTGKLSVSLRGDNSLQDLSYDEKLLYNAIISEDVSVQINASKTETINQNGETLHIFTSQADGETYGTYGGSFSGTVFQNNNGKKCAISYYFCDVDLLDENGFNQGVPHEVTEGFLLGQKTLSLGRAIPPAKEGQSNPEYSDCHERAISQTSGFISFSIGGRYCNFPPSKFGRKE